MNPNTNINEIIDKEDLFVEEIIRNINSRVDPAIVFLRAFARHMNIAASHIDCPYCAKHMKLEEEEILRVARWIESRGNKEHKHTLSEKINLIPSSIKILFYTILGGLHRAGLI